MRVRLLVLVGVFTLAGVAAAAPPRVDVYRFPLVSLEPLLDSAAHGDVYFVLQFENGRATACWQFDVFTKDRARSLALRRAPVGRQGPIVYTWDLHQPVVVQSPWPGGSEWSGCTPLPTLVARAIVRAPSSFYFETRSVTVAHAARGQLHGPVQRCTFPCG
jgi:hypothetical protein